MSAERAERIEQVIDLGAAALFAAAVGFGMWRLAPLPGMLPAAGGAGCAFALSLLALTRVRAAEPRFAFEPFAVPEVTPVEPDELLLTERAELLLTDADRVPLAPPARGGELLLDDILAELGPDSRVVRLFDRSAMPTPGQLDARIRRHLDDRTPPTPTHDDSQALYDALAELRRSLR